MFFIDHQSDSQSESLNNDYDGTFTMQPSKHALVADMGEMAFVQFVTLSLNWTSNSSALQFTMDYSMDGVQWNDYVEDERVKVRRNTDKKMSKKGLNPPPSLMGTVGNCFWRLWHWV